MIEVWHKRKVVVVGQIALGKYGVIEGMVQALVKWASDERLFPVATDAWSTFDNHTQDMILAQRNRASQAEALAWKAMIEDVLASPIMQKRWPETYLGFVFLLGRSNREWVSKSLLAHDVPGVIYRLAENDPLTIEYDDEAPDIVFDRFRATAYDMLLDD